LNRRDRLAASVGLEGSGCGLASVVAMILHIATKERN